MILLKTVVTLHFLLVVNGQTGAPMGGPGPVSSKTIATDFKFKVDGSMLKGKTREEKEKIVMEQLQKSMGSQNVQVQLVKGPSSSSAGGAEQPQLIDMNRTLKLDGSSQVNNEIDKLSNEMSKHLPPKTVSMYKADSFKDDKDLNEFVNARNSGKKLDGPDKGYRWYTPPADYKPEPFGDPFSPAVVKMALECHNAYRKKHGSPPLVYDTELEKVARAWAAHLGPLKKIAHNPNTTLGENVYVQYDMDFSAITAVKEAVKYWYDEVVDYDFEKKESKNGNFVGHFTQLVWKRTQKVGVAAVKNENCIIVVANYDPIGNTPGIYDWNVLRAVN